MILYFGIATAFLVAFLIIAKAGKESEMEGEEWIIFCNKDLVEEMGIPEGAGVIVDFLPDTVSYAAPKEAFMEWLETVADKYVRKPS